MASLSDLSTEERVGVGIAAVGHVALAAALAWHATREPPVIEPTERIDVSLANDISLESTAPDPSADPVGAFAPELGDVPQQAVDAPLETVQAPVEPAVTSPPPPPAPRRATPDRPRPQPTPQPRASQRQERPTPAPSPARSSRPTPAPSPARSQSARAPRIGSDFLEGASNADGNRGSPAATFGAAESAALNSAVTRQLRPRWSAPSGVDVELLVTVVAWELNPDGSLKGQPRVVSQSGINASNRAQADLHAERAVRAVQLAAPFNLPEQFYSRWRRLQWTFDRRL
ncbi:energy transducer TonB [Aurantiacibacter spongiae]|uniref:Energy transducer TonB n=1 Tax=Aurantiacibacter spongiae TaxID=2488860 RepID=A0A3N5DKJ6_9SPHN|nr:energy transducer TonB [Aurantiacibacter spongiae]RPF72232.1 energy transducer TonB [Aurantiacibacter spongiae]